MDRSTHSVPQPDRRHSAESRETSSRRGRQARAHVVGDDSTHGRSAGPGSANVQLMAGLCFVSTSCSLTTFGLSILFIVQPSHSSAMKYGEDVTTTSSHSLSTLRPTIGPPLYEILIDVDSIDDRMTCFIWQKDCALLSDSDIMMQDPSGPDSSCSNFRSSRSNHNSNTTTPALFQPAEEIVPRSSGLVPRH